MLWVQDKNFLSGSEIISVLEYICHLNSILVSHKPTSVVNFDGEMRSFLLMGSFGLRGLTMMCMDRDDTDDSLLDSPLTLTQNYVVPSIQMSNFASFFCISAINRREWESSIFSGIDAASGISSRIVDWSSDGPQSLHTRMASAKSVILSDMTTH